MNNKGHFLPELPCESLVRKVCGPGWRNLPSADMDGAWGVAIVKSVLDGVRPDIREIASHLGIERSRLQSAYKKLELNGVLHSDSMHRDDQLKNGDILAWSYYAGYAIGAIGPFRPA